MAHENVGPMDEETLQGIVSRLIDDAKQYGREELSPDRVEAMEYYDGEPFGNEEEGRSQVVLTEVRDGVLGVLPSILRVVFGAEHPVEFVASNPKAEAGAKQATDYISHAFVEDLDGFMQTYAVLKDGLVGRLGVYKWGWDKSATRRPMSLDGLTPEEVEILRADPDILDLEETPAEGEGTSNVTFVRSEREGRPWAMAIPPEEFLIDRAARSIESATFVGHYRDDMTRSELVALGISEEKIEEAGASPGGDDTSEEEDVRRDETIRTFPEAGAANERFRYVEGYCRVDVDGDGIAELRKICTLGEAAIVVMNERAEEAPFSRFSPDPTPHAVVGRSWADRLMDLQKIKSSVLRATLDSLAGSIFPRVSYVEGMVNVQDLLNTAMGAPIRTRQPGMVQTHEVPFVGKEAFPVLSYLDEIREGRTGQNKGTIGLDADALQSTTKGGVKAAVDASQAQAEMLTRVFVEGALKPLFRGLYRLFVRNRPKARTAKLRGGWTEVDFSTWDPAATVTVKVALGASNTEQKMMALDAILAKQSEILQTLGQDNMLVSLVEYRNTLARGVQLLGFPDTAQFFKEVTPEQLQQAAAAAAQQPPPPTPEQVLAQAQVETEKMKVEKDLAIKGQQLELDAARVGQEMELKASELQLRLRELELKSEEAALKHERELDQQRQDHTLKLTELDKKYELERDKMELQLTIEQARMATQRDVAETSARVQRANAETSASVSLTNAETTAETQRDNAALAAASNSGAESGGGEGEAKAKPKKRKRVSYSIERGVDRRIAKVHMETHDDEDES